MRSIKPVAVLASVVGLALVGVSLPASATSSNLYSPAITVKSAALTTFETQVVVNSVAELQAAVQNAAVDTEVLLSEDFYSAVGNLNASITLSIPNVHVVVNGQGGTLTAGANIRMLTINQGGSGQLEIADLTLDGNAVAAGITVNNSAGIITFNQVLVTNCKTGGNGAGLFVNNGGSSFELNIIDSTFENNNQGGTGYAGGGAYVAQMSGVVNIDGSVFRNNTTASYSPGTIFGGEGGGLMLRNLQAGSTTNITDSLFDGNQAAKDSNAGASMGDGGAIAIFDIKTGAELYVSGNSFINNISGDDGGAVLVQGNSPANGPSFNKNQIVFTNNTFVDNVAQGREGSSDNGGAVQVYAAGSGWGVFLYPIEVSFYNNTFYNNKVLGTNGFGGAISTSGGAAKAYLTGNVFVGNTAEQVKKSNVGGSAPTNTGNIGVDNGSSITYPTTHEVFGVESPVLSGATNLKVAGVAGDEIPVLLLSPTSSANKIVTSDLAEDQRGMGRPGTEINAGSVESPWVEFQVNPPEGTEGNFELDALGSFVGDIYYEGTTPSSYYVSPTATDSGYNVTMVDNLGAEIDGWNFAGWYTEDDPDTIYSPEEVVAAANGQVFKAKWEINAPIIVAGTVSIEGDLTARQTVKAVPAGWADGTSFTYQWVYSDTNDPATATPIEGATGETLDLKAEHVRGWVGVIITGTHTDYQGSATAESGPYGPVKIINTRIGGIDRYETSSLVNERFSGTGGTMFIATGELYPDALSIAPVASKMNGSLVLTSSKFLNKHTKAAIERQQPDNVVIVGQTNAVSTKVENSIKSLVGANKVSRVGGADRYETSLKVFNKYFGDGSAEVVYMATGRIYPDALTSAPAATFENGAVLLVRGTAVDVTINNAIAEMKADQVDTVKVIGRKEAISDSVYKKAEAAFDNVERIGGTDRYETAAKINEVFPSTTEFLWVASGLDFADAFTSAVPAGIQGVPVYLSRQDCMPSVTKSPLETRKYAERIYTGGTVALNNSVVNSRTVCK